MDKLLHSKRFVLVRNCNNNMNSYLCKSNAAIITYRCRLEFIFFVFFFVFGVGREGGERSEERWTKYSDSVFNSNRWENLQYCIFMAFDAFLEKTTGIHFRRHRGQIFSGQVFKYLVEITLNRRNIRPTRRYSKSQSNVRYFNVISNMLRCVINTYGILKSLISVWDCNSPNPSSPRVTLHTSVS